MLPYVLLGVSLSGASLLNERLLCTIRKKIIYSRRKVLCQLGLVCCYVLECKVCLG